MAPTAPPAGSLWLIRSRDDRHRHPIKHNIGLLVSKFSSPLIFASYSPDGIRNALPVVRFAFRNQRVQRFEHLLFTELGDELFKLTLNLSSNRRSKLRRQFFPHSTNAYLCRAAPPVYASYAPRQRVQRGRVHRYYELGDGWGATIMAI